MAQVLEASGTLIVTRHRPFEAWGKSTALSERASEPVAILPQPTATASESHRTAIHLHHFRQGLFFSR